MLLLYIDNALLMAHVTIAYAAANYAIMLLDFLAY